MGCLIASGIVIQPDPPVAHAETPGKSQQTLPEVLEWLWKEREVRSAKCETRTMTLRFGALSFCAAASVGLLWASEGDVKKPVVTVVDRNAPPSGPFACTEVMGLLTTGEWFKAGFLDAMGSDLSPKWCGRFAHYGYVYEYKTAR
jgi:hypothetical protein